MKRPMLFLFLFIFFIFSNVHADNSNEVYITSKSFFSVKPIFRPTSPEMSSLKRDRINVDEEKKLSFDVFVYGGQSFGGDRLARYFMPFGKKEVSVGELGSDFVNKENVDVIANYFGILTGPMYRPGFPVGDTLDNYTFESTLSFNPKQVFYGVTLAFKQHISRYTDKGFWYELVFPIEHVKNNMNLKEVVIRKGGPNGDDPEVPAGFVGNMTQAFKQKSWLHGKIDGPQSVTGLADPYIRAGLLYVNDENHYVDSFVGISFPTGTVPHSEYVFEPVAGNGGHATVFFGTSAGFRIFSKCETEIYLEFDTAGTVYMDNRQTRSFDLKDKQWSRYMWVYLDKRSTTTSPGINTFSKRVNVSHGSVRDLNSAYVFKRGGLQIEAGYHFFGRQSEQVRLAKDWEEGPALASIINQNDVFIGGSISKNLCTINEYLRIGNDSVDGQEVYRTIKESDLDLESAAHPTVIAHTLYGTFSYHWKNCAHPKYIGLGGSYEFSSNNDALERWMLWARFGIYF